jgi:hypothetical protein
MNMGKAKSGLWLKPGVQQEHIRMWSKTLRLQWKEQVEDKKRSETSRKDKKRGDNRPFLKRPGPPPMQQFVKR